MMVYYPDCLVENKKDYGYAYVVVLASFLSRTVLFGLVYASGIYYVAIQKDLQTSKAASAWVGSILISSVSMASMISSAAYNRYGARLTCAMSAIVSSFGLILSVFAPNVYYLVISYGIITGVGMGMALIPTVVTVTDYFDKRKHFAQSVASTGSSFGTFVGPIVIERLIQYYGWRGSMLISSAIVLNLGVIGFLFRPFHESNKMPLMCVQGSTADIKVVNWSIFRHKGFMLSSLANTGVCFANSVILIHLSAYAQWDVGLTTQQSAILLSIVGIMGVPARLIFGFIVQKKFPACGIVMFSAIIVGVSTLILPYTRGFYSLVIHCVITGAFVSANGGAVWPALLSDLLGEENLSNTMGALNLLCAVGNLSGPPIAGWLFDRSGKYIYSFITGGSVSIAAGLLMSFVCWLSSTSHQKHKAISKLKHEKLLVVERLTSL